jgi:hypothetical protein
MTIKRPTETGQIHEKISWQEKLSQVQDEFPLPLPTPQLKQEWKSYSRELQPTLIRAAAQFKISSNMLLTYIKVNKIFPIRTHKGPKLKRKDFVMLVKQFDPTTYRHFEYYFQDVIIQENLIEQKRWLKQHLKQPGFKKTKSPTSRPLPLYQPYSVPTPLSQWRQVNWTDIIFEDYAIKVKYDLNFSRSFPISESRKSFKFLKKYLLTLNREPIKILLVGNEIREIENISQLKDIVTILKVRQEFIEQFEKEKTVNAKSVLELIRALPTSFLVEIAKASSDDTICIDYLTEIQDARFKPVPAFEVISNGNSIVTEDTFIFTISNKEHLFLVWESTLHGRATYIFAANPNQYELTIQSIYDYIASHQKAKRMKLRKKNADVIELNYVNFITHSSFEHWREKLTKVISVS